MILTGKQSISLHTLERAVEALGGRTQIATVNLSPYDEPTMVVTDAQYNPIMYVSADDGGRLVEVMAR
jgi:hypothetical protein